MTNELKQKLDEKRDDGALTRKKAMDTIDEHWRVGKIAEQNFRLGFDSAVSLLMPVIEKLMAQRDEAIIYCGGTQQTINENQNAEILAAMEKGV